MVGSKRGIAEKDGKRMEKLRAELEELLAHTCPLCESVVTGLDRPFVKEGDVDSTWDL